MAALPLLIVLASPQSSGQSVVPPGEDLLGRTIVDVVVDGVDPEMVEGLAGLPGSPLTRPMVRSLIETLWQTGRYRDVRVDAAPLSGGVRVVVRLDLRRRIRTLDARGNDHLDLRELRRIAGFVPDSEEHPDLLNEMRGRIETAYAMRGYPNASVEFKVEETGEPGRIALVAAVTEGEPIRVASIRFTGTPVYPQPMILDVFGVAPGDPWNQIALGDAAERLKRFYRDRGFLLADVREPEPTSLDDGRIALVVHVDSGRPTRIQFGGNRHVDAAELAAVIALDEDPDLSPTGLGNACDRIAEHYRKLGFPDAGATWSVAEEPWGPLPDEALDEIPPGDFYGTLFTPWTGAPGVMPGSGPIAYLRFRIDEGPRLRVPRIDWRGNEYLSDEELTEMVEEFTASAIDAPALFQPFPPGELGSLGLSGERSLGESGRLPLRLAGWRPAEIYIEQAYREAAVQATQRYRIEGFLDAEVTLADPERDPVAGTIVPAFVVLEGPRSMLRSIAVEGNAAIETDEIEDVFLLEADEPVNEMLVEETRQKIVELYASHGYLFATVQTRAEFTEDRTLADLAYVVEEGPQVRVRAIEVTGNEETATSLILGTLAFAEGDVFSPETAEASEQRLLRMGIFQGVTIAPAAPEVVEAKKTILVQVRERPPQMLELRAGFSTAEGVRGAFEYAYRNLFGYAIGLRLQIKLNYQFFFLGNETFEEHFDALSLEEQLERSVVAGVQLPYLPGLGGLLATQVDFASERDNRPFYGIDRTNVFAGFSTGWHHLLTFQLRGGIEHNDVLAFAALPPLCTGDEPPGTDCLTLEDSRRLRLPNGVSTFSVVRSSFTLDLRDSPFNPTRGIYVSATAEWVRSFSPVDDPGTEDVTERNFSHLIKTSFVLSGYVPLLKEMVLALSAHFGEIFQLERDSITFPDRYFYLGGFDTIRGFPQESVAAADSDPDHPQAGGDMFVIFRAELRFPLAESFAGALFTDIGNLWRDPSNFDVTALRYTAGAGLRIGTPIGPLTFDYAINLDPRDHWGEEFGALHFSIGMF